MRTLALTAVSALSWSVVASSKMLKDSERCFPELLPLPGALEQVEAGPRVTSWMR